MKFLDEGYPLRRLSRESVLAHNDRERSSETPV